MLKMLGWLRERVRRRPAAGEPARPPNASCSFCRRGRADAGPLAEGPGPAFICGECVRQCGDAIANEAARHGDQAAFAEALSQALAAGVGAGRAVAAAAGAVRTPRLREAFQEMAANCRRGYTLAESLSRAGAAVGCELLAALAVGEDRGDLPESLAAFARRCDPRPGPRLAAAVGRSAEVTRFAAGLARLLRDRPLTVGLIGDAARLAGGDGSAFAAAVGRVAERMRGGTPFPAALSAEAGTFDPLFCTLVAAPDGRDHLRAVLARVGEAPDAEPGAAAGPGGGR